MLSLGIYRHGGYKFSLKLVQKNETLQSDQEKNFFLQNTVYDRGVATIMTEVLGVKCEA